MALLSCLYMVPFLVLSFYTHYATAKPGVISVPFEKREISDPILLRRLRKRAGSANGPLGSYENSNLYLMNITVGTPPQPMSVVVDTGSSDVWVAWSGLQLCTTGVCTFGTYDPTKSSTFAEVQAGTFDAAYGDDTKVSGDFINETLSIGGVNFNNLMMGFAKNGSVPEGLSTTPFTGIIGVSYTTGEFMNTEQNKTYPTVVSQMVTQGVIGTEAFSLWLNDINSTQGTVLFGGVDTTKYSGDLIVLPLQPDPTENKGVVDSFYVTLAGIELLGNKGASLYSVSADTAVLLDSGSSNTYVPTDVFNALVKGLGGEVINGIGAIPCSLVNSQGVLKFKFGSANGAVISAKLSEFVGVYLNGTLDNGAAACRLRMTAQDTNGLILGDSFLRSAYLVYNIAGNTIAIAQANFNVSSSSIVAITATDSIPGATSTATGTPVAASTPAFSSASSASGTWDLGTATGAGSPAATSSGAASGLMPPSSSFLATVVTGIAVLFGLIGGSMVILI